MSNYDGVEKITNFAAQYKEELIEDELFFNAYFVDIGGLKYYGHLSMMQKKQYKDDEGSFPKLNQKADFI
jgi:hypothetical protein